MASELVPPVTHLSRAADNTRLAVSVAGVQDNQGWNLDIVSTADATGYAAGTGVSSVPVTGLPEARRLCRGASAGSNCCPGGNTGGAGQRGRSVPVCVWTSRPLQLEG